MRIGNTLQSAGAIVMLVLALVPPAPALSQMKATTNLSSYGGNSKEARAARGYCWKKVGIPYTRSPQNDAEASAIRNCVDKQLAGGAKR